MKRLALTLALSFACFSGMTQSKMLTMQDAVFNPKLAPENLKKLQWIAATDQYSWVIRKDGKELLLRASVSSAQVDTLLSSDELSSGMSAFSDIEWISPAEFIFIRNNERISYNLSDKLLKPINKYPEEGMNPEVSPDGQRVAYTLEQDLWLSADGKQQNISNEKNKDIVYGQAAHRNEFGIKKGIFWSPDGNKIAFYRMDQTMVTEYPLITEVESAPAIGKSIRYPMAGQKSDEVTLGIYDLQSNSTIYLKTGEPRDQYLTNIAWSPDSRSVNIAVVSRDYTTMKMNRYDAATGAFIQTLFTETDSKYVEPSEPMTFLQNGNFLWFSERDGFRHLYLYKNNGQLIRQVTKGNFVITGFHGLDAKEQTAYITSTAASPLERQAYAVSLSTGKITRLTAEKGTHVVTFSADKKYFFDSYSSTNVPRKIMLKSNAGKEIRTLLTAPNPVEAYAFGEMDIFTIKAADERTDLYGRLFKPINFDPAKKYPVVVYVYGGPHVQLISDSWLGGANLWFQLMAEKGYIVFTVDSRGSMYRGRAFEQTVYRNLGLHEIADQVKGVDYLKTLPYVDTTRMGIHGWSYGGFLTTAMMLKRPGLFKAAVCGGPVINWSMYEIMYTERYMDTPEENPEGYAYANLLNEVSKLEGKLLMIHGTVDDVVVWQHSLAFLKKCVDEGVQLDYFVYPGHPHNVRGKDRVHLMNKVTGYFDTNLK
jgi:dipeptidyl-peptidase-4